VSLVPVGLVVVSGEQAVTAEDSQRLDLGADVLAEPGFVVEVAFSIADCDGASGS
jgi:hypothetical protein